VGHQINHNVQYFFRDFYAPECGFFCRRAAGWLAG
jgi:hypothetical protein